MTPEEKARQKIDQWFTDAGRKVVDREDYEPTCTAVVIREGLLRGNLEAKKEEIDVFSDKVCEQAVLYARNIPNIY